MKWPVWSMDATDARRSPMMEPAPVREVWSLNPDRPLTQAEFVALVDDFRRAFDSSGPYDPVLVGVPLMRAEMEIRLP
jgi:hypothetical protein